MGRIGFVWFAILLAGCCAVRHQPPTDPKTEPETVAPALKMETISFDAGDPYSSVETEDPVKRAEEWKESCRSSYGTTWPEGSSITWTDGGGIIHFTNTAENLLKILRGISNNMPDYGPSSTLIEMDVQIVEAGPEALAAVGIGGQAHLDNAAEKRETLLKRDDARLFETFHLITKIGQESVASAATEYIYPTEYEIGPYSAATNDTPRTSDIATVVLANFETREVGTRFQFVPEVYPDLSPSSHIRFMMDVTVTGKPVWKDYSRRNPPSETTDQRLPMEQPFFPNQKISTQFTATNDETLAMVMGGLSRTGDGSTGKTLVLFITPHIIRLKSELFTPIRLKREP